MVSWQNRAIVNSTAAANPSANSALLRTLGRNRWVQAAALVAFWLAVETVSRRLHLPLPGSVFGFFALWALLESRVLPLSWIERGADSLLSHLVLFFVPAMLALVGHPELLSITGVKLLVAILVGTLFVMTGTALVVEFGFRWSERRVSR